MSTFQLLFFLRGCANMTIFDCSKTSLFINLFIFAVSSWVSISPSNSSTITWNLVLAIFDVLAFLNLTVSWSMADKFSPLLLWYTYTDTFGDSKISRMLLVSFTLLGHILTYSFTSFSIWKCSLLFLSKFI